MSVDSVNNNRSNVLGWTLGGAALGGAAGTGVGYLASSPVKNGEFKDSFIKSSVDIAKKDFEQTANNVIRIFEDAAKKTNIDDITKSLKENLSKTNGFEKGLAISGYDLDSFLDFFKSLNVEDAQKTIAAIVENVKEEKAFNSLIDAESLKGTFKDAVNIKGNKIEFTKTETSKAIEDLFEKCLKAFKKSNMLKWGGIGAAVLGLGGLVIGLSKKNNA